MGSMSTRSQLVIKAELIHWALVSALLVSRMPASYSLAVAVAVAPTPRLRWWLWLWLWIDLAQ